MRLMSVKDIRFPFSLRRINERLPLFANTILLIAVAYSLASLTWMVIPSPEFPAAPPLSVQKTNSATQPVNEDAFQMQSVANLHLFGKVETNKPKPAPPPPPPTPKIAPDTELRLTLRGVFASSAPESSWAIIADRVGNEEFYRIDDNEKPLPGGAIIKEIHQDRIILLHNNRFETLRLPQDQLPTNRAQTRSASNVRSSRSTASSRRSPSRRPLASTTTVSPQARQTLRNYRDKLINDPQSMLNVLRAEPFRRGGKLQGYRIFPGQDKRIMGDIGLRSGDVVTSVNGISLDSPLKGLEVMQDLAGASEITVDVLRDGVSQSMVVPLN